MTEIPITITTVLQVVWLIGITVVFLIGITVVFILGVINFFKPFTGDARRGFPLLAMSAGMYFGLMFRDFLKLFGLIP